MDPIHLGHVRIIEALIDQTDFTRILVIPVHKPPHKEADGLVSDQDRLEMIRLALDPKIPYAQKMGRIIQLDQCEISRGGISYTIDTIHQIQQTYQVSGRIGVVIGDDLVGRLRTWAKWDKLVSEVEFIVADRSDPDVPVSAMPPEAKYRRLAGIDLPISSSQVRSLCASGLDISGLVPEEVAAYIMKHGLYAH